MLHRQANTKASSGVARVCTVVTVSMITKTICFNKPKKSCVRSEAPLAKDSPVSRAICTIRTFHAAFLTTADSTSYGRICCFEGACLVSILMHVDIIIRIVLALQ